jgi:hypothetical protein
MESTRNAEETREGDNPRGQYPIPSCHRTIDQSKKEKKRKKKSFGIRDNRLEAQGVELGDL